MRLVVVVYVCVGVCGGEYKVYVVRCANPRIIIEIKPNASTIANRICFVIPYIMSIYIKWIQVQRVQYTCPCGRIAIVRCSKKNKNTK